MTDFGTANDAVAICRAVIVGIVPDVHIMDITHQVTPFSIEEGARFLAGVTPYYPAGTVFLGVVDPGVGTSRKAVIVKSKKEQYFVVPDNVLITPVADRDGVEGVREITNPAWMIGDTGQVMGLDDPFGSLITDIQGDDFKKLGVGWSQSQNRKT
jgi:S-adenosylmethionine hydrolase